MRDIVLEKIKEIQHSISKVYSELDKIRWDFNEVINREIERKKILFPRRKPEYLKEFLEKEFLDEE